jgi:hypothetical protein
MLSSPTQEYVNLGAAFIGGVAVSKKGKHVEQRWKFIILVNTDFFLKLLII